MIKEFQSIKHRYGNPSGNPHDKVDIGSILIRSGVDAEEMNRRFTDKNLKMEIEHGTSLKLSPQLIEVSFYCSPGIQTDPIESKMRVSC